MCAQLRPTDVASARILLGAVGLLLIIACVNVGRTREMGIRMALGATGGAVSLLIVRDGCRLAAVGVALGLAGAYASTRTLRSLLFDVSVTDPAVFVAAAIILRLIAVGASWRPARAATRVNPLDAVRAE